MGRASKRVNLFFKKNRSPHSSMFVCVKTSVLVCLGQNIVKHSKIKGKGVVKCLQGRMLTFLN